MFVGYKIFCFLCSGVVKNIVLEKKLGNTRGLCFTELSAKVKNEHKI